MKKLILTLLPVMLWSVLLNAQNKKDLTEVLYFKANLACCKARACNALETEIRDMVAANFPDSSIHFREVKLADTNNAQLIEKYKAASQTLIVVRTRKKKVWSDNLSDLVKKYQTDGDRSAFEKGLVSRISAIQKHK